MSYLDLEKVQPASVQVCSLQYSLPSALYSSQLPSVHFFAFSDADIVIKYINTKWGEIQQKVIEECGDDPRKKLVEISIAYVKFLCANPAFQSVLMLNDNSLSPEQLAQKAKISELTEKIISEYCSSVGMNDADRKRKTYAVRSFIFGAAFMINSGFFCDDEENISLVRYCIEREFDLK